MVRQVPSDRTTGGHLPADEFRDGGRLKQEPRLHSRPRLIGDSHVAFQRSFMPADDGGARTWFAGISGRRSSFGHRPQCGEDAWVTDSFVRWYRRLVLESELWEQSTDAQWRVATFILMKVDHRDGSMAWRYDDVARELGMSRRTLQRCVSFFDSIGWASLHRGRLHLARPARWGVTSGTPVSDMGARGDTDGAHINTRKEGRADAGTRAVSSRLGRDGLVALHRDLFVRKFGAPPLVRPKDIANLDRLMKSFPSGDIADRMTTMFERPPSFPRDARTLTDLYTHFDRFILSRPAVGKTDDRKTTAGKGEIPWPRR